MEYKHTVDFRISRPNHDLIFCRTYVNTDETVDVCFKRAYNHFYEKGGMKTPSMDSNQVNIFYSIDGVDGTLCVFFNQKMSDVFKGFIVGNNTITVVITEEKKKLDTRLTDYTSPAPIASKFIIFSVIRSTEPGMCMPYRVSANADETIDICFRRTYHEVYTRFEREARPIDPNHYKISYYIDEIDMRIDDVKPDTMMGIVFQRFMPGEEKISVIIEPKDQIVAAQAACSSSSTTSRRGRRIIK